MQTTYQNNLIKVSQPRQSVQVSFGDGLVLSGPVGSTVEDFLNAAQAHDPNRYPGPFMGAIINTRLRELTYPINWDSRIEAVLLSSSDGGRIYRRSLVLLMSTAIDELWPGVKVNVSYAVPEGGFYCQLANREPLNRTELDQLEAHMRDVVAQNEIIGKKIVPLDKAVEIFKERNDLDKIRLLEQRTRQELTLYSLRGRDDYYFGHMVPSTGYLTTFRLHSTGKALSCNTPVKNNRPSLAPS